MFSDPLLALSLCFLRHFRRLDGLALHHLSWTLQGEWALHIAARLLALDNEVGLLFVEHYGLQFSLNFPDWSRDLSFFRHHAVKKGGIAICPCI